MSPAVFSYTQGNTVDEVRLSGRLDASQCDAALNFLNGVVPLRILDLDGLEYISSAGLRVILLTQKRCKSLGSGVRLVNVSTSIFDIFHYAGFDQILDITRSAG